MELRERTNALFTYLTAENKTLKQQIAQLRIVLSTHSPPLEAQIMNLHEENTRLRQQIRNNHAEMLICRQLYHQSQEEKMMVAQDFGIRERLRDSEILILKQKLALLEANIVLPSGREGLQQHLMQMVNVPINRLTLGVWAETDSIISYINYLRDQCKLQRQKRKALSIVVSKINISPSKKLSLQKGDSSDQRSFSDSDKMQDSSDSEEMDQDVQPTSKEQQTYASLSNKKQSAPRTLPKLKMKKARQFQKLMLQKMEQKEPRKIEDLVTLKRQIQQLKQKNTSVLLENVALSRKADCLERYIRELEERNKRIIHMRTEQVPIQAYELSRR